MRPALSALLLACTLVGSLAARSALAGRGDGPSALPQSASPRLALPHPLAERLVARTAMPIGGIVTGTLAVASCPEGVATVILPAFDATIDPDVGIARGDGMRFLTFYAGFRLPDTSYRVAVTALHLVRSAAESFRLRSPTFATDNVVRFAVPRDCPPMTDAELGRVMAAVAAP